MKKIFASLGVLSVGAAAFATETAETVSVSMPGSMDLAGVITSGVTIMAGVVAAALGAFVSFLLVKKALAWIRKAF